MVANHPSGCKAQIPRRAWVLWWRKGVSQRVPCHEAWNMMRWSGGSPRQEFFGHVRGVSLSLTPFKELFTMTHSYFNFKGFEIRIPFFVFKSIILNKHFLMGQNYSFWIHGEWHGLVIHKLGEREFLVVEMLATCLPARTNDTAKILTTVKLSVSLWKAGVHLSTRNPPKPVSLWVIS